MKKNTILVIAAVTVGSLISFEAMTFTSGAPSGRNGSPASQNVTCAVAGCHAGGPAVSTQTITITNDIPANGFAENTDYNFTITVADGGTSSSKVGYEASIEDGSGHVGTLTPGTDSKMTGSFLTHTSAGTPMSGGTRDYTFTWNSGTAPDGSTVYVAVNFSNSNNGTTGDVIATETLSLTKASGVSLEENKVDPIQIAPNPASAFTRLSDVSPRTKEIEVYSLDGKLVMTYGEDSKINATEWEINLDSFSNGTYLVLPKGGSIEKATKLQVSK